VKLRSALGTIRTLVLSLHGLLLLPVGITAAMAYGNYTAYQCDEPGYGPLKAVAECTAAYGTMRWAVLYVLLAPMLWVGFRLLENLTRKADQRIEAAALGQGAAE
jgi:hypothetical protein